MENDLVKIIRKRDEVGKKLRNIKRLEDAQFGEIEDILISRIKIGKLYLKLSKEALEYLEKVYYNEKEFVEQLERYLPFDKWNKYLEEFIVRKSLLVKKK